MLSVTSTLAAAIGALVRRPVAQVLVEWDNDTYSDVYFDTYGVSELAGAAGSVVVDRAITTDLPAEANIVEGDAAGQATVALVTDINGVSPAQTLSPYTAHLGGGRRVGVPVTVKFGFVTDAGTEWVPALVGKVRTAATSDDGTATLTTLDGPELLRTAVTLPVVVALDQATGVAPGLNAQWVMDYILRANGFHASPPLRSSPVLSATLHGSTWPEVGTLIASAWRESSSPQGIAPLADGSHGTMTYTSSVLAGRANFTVWQLSAPVPMTNGSTLLLELDRVTCDDPSAVSNEKFIQLGTSNLLLGNQQVTVGVFAGGCLDIIVIRGGTTGFYRSAPGAIPIDGSEFYIGVHITFTTAGFDYQALVDGVSHSGSVALATAATGTLQYGGLLGNSTAETAIGGLQVTTEAYDAGMWDDDFVPTAVLQPSLNELTCMPAVEDRMPWPLILEIVEAEQGVILFVEEGIVRFYNRDHMTGGTAVAVMRAVRELKGVSASETIDSVRNIIRVPAAPLKVDTVDSIIWATSETLMVPASGTLIVPARVDGPAVSLDTALISYTAISGITATAGSGYRAARNSDGTGGDVSNLAITVAQYPARLVMFITNPNAFDVWLVNNSLDTAVEPDIAGRPLLQIVGRLARAPENPYTSRATDSGSVGTYGEQPLDVGENIWRQSVSAAESLSASLLAMLKEPHAVLNGVEVVGDPRRQLTDRVTLIDTEGIGWARDVWLLGITSRLDNGGFSQSVAVREAGSATSGMTGTFTWDVSLWDSLDGWVA